MRFKFLVGDVNWKDYGGKFISPKLHNGDWPYYLILDVTNWHEATGDEEQPKYCVSIIAVSPEAAGPENVEKALDSCGIDPDIFPEKLAEELKAEALATYGIFACLWQRQSNNINTLLKEARREANLITSLFGFYMDRPENRIGQDGWSLIRGQDIREFLEIGG